MNTSANLSIVRQSTSNALLLDWSPDYVAFRPCPSLERRMPRSVACKLGIPLQILKSQDVTLSVDYSYRHVCTYKRHIRIGSDCARDFLLNHQKLGHVTGYVIVTVQDIFQCLPQYPLVRDRQATLLGFPALFHLDGQQALEAAQLLPIAPRSMPKLFM